MVWAALAAAAVEKGISGASDESSGSQAGEADTGTKTAGRDITDQKQETKQLQFSTGAKSFNTTGINLGSILQPFTGPPANGGFDMQLPSPLIAGFNKPAATASNIAFKSPQQFGVGLDKTLTLGVAGIVGLSVVLMMALRKR